MTSATRYQISASACLIALIFLCLAWEGWLAPLRPGGSWMVLKGAFLLVPLFGILRGKRYTYKWLSLFIQFYLMEGLLRATSDQGLSQQLAIGETILATLLFVLTILFVRATRGSPPKEKAA
ncbi:DUF2069 domain-containing protein [Dechloromonas sp. HYN0024]|uniref:DUF2069 domain-containing protein n=1 Tax=Dechloromonas sp. HYN0024 TaxID=2231055 RepID=UPI000E43A820|nr:DUF2069 domain-containing protein [Dechloromonas sp. HYN0024]AXS79390.1 DUF2069 domain-containing protein [Dechloromonas sp. HYN0024]